MANIAFYGSHNSAYVVEEGGKILLVLEVERFLNYKNSGLAQYMCPKPLDILFFAQYIPEFIMKHLNISEFENFCVSVPLVNDLFGQWDASYCIGMAMMT